MNNPPQNVTERYVSNLLHNGQNREFIIKQVSMEPNYVEQVLVGYYSHVILNQFADEKGYTIGVGATPAQALRNALDKHGVTFR